jgi:nucleotide-binding universal stress UspA family protein
MSAARERMTELAETLPKDTIAETMIRVGSPWREICAVAAETDAEMIVMGAHGYGAIDRFLGTTAANVVNHADRSVFIVREREAVAA